MRAASALMTLAPSAELAAHELFRHLGPEPLDDAFDGAILGAALAGRRTPIKAALLDQRTVAGVGNIYACEALFHAGISPRRLAATVQGDRADRLVKAVRWCSSRRSRPAARPCATMSSRRRARLFST